MQWRMPSLRRCFSCGITLFTALRWSQAFYIPSLGRNFGWKLHATPPKWNKNVLKAKHAILTVAAAILSVPSDVFTSPPMLEPPARSMKERKHREAVSKLLEQGWNTLEGFSRAISEPDDFDSGPDASTYGEITKLGARQLFHYMKMTNVISSFAI